MKKLFVLLLFSAISISGFSQKPMTEEKFREYFLKNKDSLDAIEGIWQVSTSQEFYRNDTMVDDMEFSNATTVAVKKDSSGFKSYSLKDQSADVSFKKTDVKGVYFYQISFHETNEYSESKAVISTHGEMEYKYGFPEKYLRFKLGDSYEQGTTVVNKVKWTKVFRKQLRNN